MLVSCNSESFAFINVFNLFIFNVNMLKLVLLFRIVLIPSIEFDDQQYQMLFLDKLKLLKLNIFLSRFAYQSLVHFSNAVAVEWNFRKPN